MFLVEGIVKEVVTGRTVKGAFGDASALLCKVESRPGSDYTDYVFIPDTAKNRETVVAGFVLRTPVSVEAVPYKGGAFLSARADYHAK